MEWRGKQRRAALKRNRSFPFPATFIDDCGPPARPGCSIHSQTWRPGDQIALLETTATHLSLPISTPCGKERPLSPPFTTWPSSSQSLPSSSPSMPSSRARANFLYSPVSEARGWKGLFAPGDKRGNGATHADEDGDEALDKGRRRRRRTIWKISPRPREWTAALNVRERAKKRAFSHSQARQWLAGEEAPENSRAFLRLSSTLHF